MYALIARFESLLYQWAGQWFPESRRGDLQDALISAAKRYGYTNRINDFIIFLENNPPKQICDEIVQSILVGETYFFRDQQLWDSLKEEILPELIKERNAQRSLRIWSAGCSSGEEVYSIAVVIKEFFPNLIDWNVKILGTDISERSLSRAHEAIYNQRSTRGISDYLKLKWFEKEGTNLKINPKLRELTSFFRQNLCDLNFPNHTFKDIDLLICRNVLIYLSKDYVNKIMEHFYKCLSPRGWLILAPTEIPFELPSYLHLQYMKSKLLVLRPREATLNTKATAISTDLALNLDLTASSSNLFIQVPSLSLPSKSNSLHDSIGRSLSLEESAVKTFTDNLSNEDPSNFSLPSQFTSSNQAIELARQARCYADKGDFAQALISATQSIDYCPTYVDGWMILATIQRELELHEEAIESLHRAIYLDPNTAVAYLQLAQAMYKNKDYNFQRYVAIFNKLVENMDDGIPLKHGFGLKVSEAKHLAETLQKFNQTSDPVPGAHISLLLNSSARR
ncbi:MAG: CheR family methyltransferase [Candidatus Bruticola sp.]